MVLQLHIWGPAFSLPSIDPQCLATVAYFSLVVPKDAWVLVASSDPTVSPTNELPALKNGSTWVSRFRNIVDYLRQYSHGEWDLDNKAPSGTQTTTQQRADSIAFASFLESRAQPLLDLSLYVTSQNYSQATSPAYAALLQWPAQWLLPPRLHSAAKHRTEHLGLSSLDLAAIEEQRKRDLSAAVAAGQLPESFLHNRALTAARDASAASATLARNQFKLEALTANLFDPLEEILADKAYLLTTERDGPTTLDCLATGYLLLALVPDVPYAWLRDAMRTKAPRLTALVERIRRSCFGPSDVVLADAYPPTPASTDNAATASAPLRYLPWQAPDRPRLVTAACTVVDAVADALPIVRDVRVNNRLREAAQAPQSGLSAVESQTLAAYATGQKKDVLMSVAAVVGGVAALVAYMVSVGTFSLAVEEEEEEEEEEAGGQMPAPADLDPESFQVGMGDLLAAARGS
ncbi:Tom37 C-terminal domain-containing protein [Aspergillus ambiguus]|uniref:glutathione S-transferase family protein n=1 Tax=Aspergillus ambiguus TaxID=176160 RepID=UPI003CCE2B46